LDISIGCPVEKPIGCEDHRAAIRLGLQFLPMGFTFDGLIVDVGANRGEFTAMMCRIEPRCRVIAFEPGSAPLSKLVSRLADDPAVTIHSVAVSDKEGTADLFVMEASEFSSLQRFRDESDVAIVGQETVRITTLDSVISDPVRLLKIDVQGHEMRVIAGASETLARTDAVLLEVVFGSQYEGDATFCAVNETMEAHGFVFAGVAESRGTGGRARWSDACYLRTS
jgi:FkbM family methyltransferase